MLLKPIKYIIKELKSTKISVKITILYALIFSLLLLALNASTLYGIKYYFYSQANKQIEDVKTIILNKIKSQNRYGDLEDKKLVSDVPYKQNMAVRILLKDGKVLNETSNFDYIIKNSESFDKIQHIEEAERHLVFENTKLESNNYGIAYIQTVKDMYSEYYFMKVLFIIMAIADFIGVITSIILGYIISKKMLKPISDITRTAESISINNLQKRIEADGPDDELKMLSNTFNNMINRLQKSFDRQVQFVSDASHELKTPIAVINGYANLLDRWGKEDKEALEKSIYAIKQETENMADLVERLLLIAKGDSGTQKIEKKKFFLNELIDEVVGESKLIASKHIISSANNDIVSIVADYNMLKQMLRILIDNSIKFSPRQSTIDISSELHGSKVRITVSDTGIGIPEKEIERIFDRFYTVDKSRSKEKSGTGLGLSIAKWIVDMHDGTIEVESEEGKYTKIIVLLSTKNEKI